MLLVSLLLACAADDSCGDDTAAPIATSTATSTATASSTGTGTGTGAQGGAGAPPDNFFRILSETGGCGDLCLYAYNPEETLSMVVNIAGLATEARGSEGTVVRSWGLSESVDGLQVGARQGLDVTQMFCNPGAAGEGGGGSRDWVATGGTLEVSALADEVGTIHATLSLTGATFALADGTSTSVVTGGDIAFEADIAE